MDGTLVDTEPLWFAAEAAIAERHGVPWGPELSAQLVGMPLERYAQMLVERGVELSAPDVVAALVGWSPRGWHQITWQPGVLPARRAVRGGRAVRPGDDVLPTAGRRGGRPAPAGAFRVVVTGDASSTASRTRSRTCARRRSWGSSPDGASRWRTRRRGSARRWRRGPDARRAAHGAGNRGRDSALGFPRSRGSAWPTWRGSSQVRILDLLVADTD